MENIAGVIFDTKCILYDFTSRNNPSFYSHCIMNIGLFFLLLYLSKVRTKLISKIAMLEENEDRRKAELEK